MLGETAPFTSTRWVLRTLKRHTGARDYSQTGWLVYHWVKRMPSLAILSRFGETGPGQRYETLSLRQGWLLAAISPYLGNRKAI
jgi:hypothetical protein